jgi:hypothetical protein
VPSKKKEIPPLLRQKRGTNESPEVTTRRFLQLLEFCGATREAEEFVKHPEGSKDALFWHLAMYARISHGLLAYFFKAYQPKGRSAVAVDDWIAAGGPPMYAQTASAHFYEAQLVQLIHKLDEKHGKGREWVFRWLANEEAAGGPREAQRRLAMLPARYKRRRTAGAIRVAYHQITKAVRECPEDYLPPPVSRLAWALAYGRGIDGPFQKMVAKE